MSIEIIEAPVRHRYEAVVDGVVGGYVEYETDADRITLTHTKVEDEFEGQGVGSSLARAVLDSVRGRDGPVEIKCPFLREWIERHPDYQDML